MKYLVFMLCLLFGPVTLAQYCLPEETLSVDDIVLREIDLRLFNRYQFETALVSDSVLLLIPKGLPFGYFEVYYENDTNKLALIYYNYGRSAYAQQFYKNGAIKSDTEYSVGGKRHGVHVVYDRQGNEIWHAEYHNGQLDRKYHLDYITNDNVTTEAINTGRAFGVYEFLPTPSRARKDRIVLNRDTTFVYYDSNSSCDFCVERQGTWVENNGFLLLRLNDEKYWRSQNRKMVIKATTRLMQLELLEVRDCGIDWYHSNYYKLDKTN